jgi:hypothetical protein
MSDKKYNIIPNGSNNISPKIQWCIKYAKTHASIPSSKMISKSGLLVAPSRASKRFGTVLEAPKFPVKAVLEEINSKPEYEEGCTNSKEKKMSTYRAIAINTLHLAGWSSKWHLPHWLLGFITVVATFWVLTRLPPPAPAKSRKPTIPLCPITLI